ncbi:MAG: gamma carbonic anhydrase family protein [Proteobacteria bacterium]|nr:gamma carbonic anhydrase family protein [Pseudomonadota bacterium]
MSIYSLDQATPQIDPTAFIAPNAIVIGRARVGKNSSVWFNSVIRADFETITIGDDTNIQDLTMCHADEGKPLTIGNRVTVGHNCVVHGCTIEDDCLIGMGVVVMNGAIIRKGSIIAAGSVILENTDIPEKSLVAGAPGKIKRSLDEGVIDLMASMADIYTNRSHAYKDPARFVRLG